ncbi:MAG: hypothetical protein ABI234_15760 [Ktedonobacteraceae bacterium]
MLNISPASISAFNSKERESPDAKDAFVATICPIIPISFSVMNARCGKMRQPPQEQEEHEQQTIYTI